MMRTSRSEAFDLLARVVVWGGFHILRFNKSPFDQDVVAGIEAKGADRCGEEIDSAPIGFEAWSSIGKRGYMRDVAPQREGALLTLVNLRAWAGDAEDVIPVIVRPGAQVADLGAGVDAVTADLNPAVASLAAGERATWEFVSEPAVAAGSRPPFQGLLLLGCGEDFFPVRYHTGVAFGMPAIKRMDSSKWDGSPSEFHHVQWLKPLRQHRKVFDMW